MLGDVGRLAAAVGIDMKDAFSLFEHFNPGQTPPQRCPSEGIARGEGQLDVAAGTRVPV